MSRFFLSVLIAAFSVIHANAEGIVSRITSAPVFANGIVKDIPAGLNIHLQTDNVQGLDFMDPRVVGYGVPPGGSLEVELQSGFERDPSVPLDGTSLLLTVGAPQQGLPEKASGHVISQGENEFTYVIRPTGKDGMLPDQLRSPAKGATLDPSPQRGIKILHIGRSFPFISRGSEGVVEVRFKDRSGSVIARGKGTVQFLQEPRPQIYPTNVTHDQRNHNWQKVGPGEVVGVANDTLPMPFLLFDRNEGIGNKGLDGVGVLSLQQLEQIGFQIPQGLSRFTGGLLFQDANGDGILNPVTDTIMGGVRNQLPEGAEGFQVITPLVNDKPFLSRPTGDFNERAGNAFGGSLLQVVAVAGNRKGLYRTMLTLLEKPGDEKSPDGSSVTYTIVVE